MFLVEFALLKSKKFDLAAKLPFMKLYFSVTFCFKLRLVLIPRRYLGSLSLLSSVIAFWSHDNHYIAFDFVSLLHTVLLQSPHISLTFCVCMHASRIMTLFFFLSCWKQNTEHEVGRGLCLCWVSYCVPQERRAAINTLFCTRI